MDCFIGIDLAQARDFTAVVILERIDCRPYRWNLVHLDRWQGVSYPATAARIGELVNCPELEGCRLAVDQTGVGRPVVDMLRTKTTRHITAINITGGTTVSRAGPYALNVPKRELIRTTQLLLQDDRLKIARELPLTDVLTKELNCFQVQITAAANETFSGDRRAGQHDDLVLSLSLACWLGENTQEVSLGIFEDWENPDEQPPPAPKSRLQTILDELRIDLDGDW